MIIKIGLFQNDPSFHESYGFPSYHCLDCLQKQLHWWVWPFFCIFLQFWPKELLLLFFLLDPIQKFCLKIAKTENCQTWKLLDLKAAKIESCQNWKLPKLKDAKIAKMFWPHCFPAHLKGRSFPSSAYYTSKGILRFAKPHSINLSTTFLPTKLCTRRSPEQHLQGR